jgi:hypothetical protein
LKRSVFLSNVCRPGTGFVKPAATVIGKVPRFGRLLPGDEKGHIFKAVFGYFLCFLTMGEFLIVVDMTVLVMDQKASRRQSI